MASSILANQWLKLVISWMEVSYKTFTDMSKEISLRGNDNITGKNNGFPFLDILGYLKNTHKYPKFGKVRQVPTREFPTTFPDWDLSHSSKFGMFVKYPKISKNGDLFFFPVNISPNTNKSERNGLLNEKVSEISSLTDCYRESILLRKCRVRTFEAWLPSQHSTQTALQTVPANVKV